MNSSETLFQFFLSEESLGRFVFTHNCKRIYARIIVLASKSGSCDSAPFLSVIVIATDITPFLLLIVILESIISKNYCNWINIKKVTHV
jgi:hypothetical protein